MRKKEQGAAPAKSGKGKKILFIVLAFLVLAAVAIVLALTYWPAKTADITNSIDSAVSTSLNLDGETYTTINGFINDHKEEMKTESLKPDADIKYANYYNEMQSFSNIVVSVSKSLEFYKNTLGGSVEGSYTRKEVKKLNADITDSTNKMQEVAGYINEYKDQATNFTIVNSVWEGLRGNYQAILNDYVNIYKKIEEIYYKGKLKGVYGNDATLISVVAMRNYIELTYQNLFVNGDDLEPANGYTISKNMKNFVAIYEFGATLENPIQNIIKYYKNDICQKNIAVVKDVENATEGKITFAYLIQNNFNTTPLSLTPATQKYADAAIKFLQGKNLTQTLLIPEGGE